MLLTHKMVVAQSTEIEALRIRLKLACPELNFDGLLSEAAAEAKVSRDASFFELVKSKISLAIAECSRG